MAASFDFHRRLGAGNFGEVWHVTETGLDAEFALKIIPPSKLINPSNFFHEAQLLKAAEHPNVVRINETGSLNDGRLYVAMEYLSRGSVEDEAKGQYLPLSRAKRLMIDLLRGLQHAHNQGVLHRDVKPGNILVGNNGEGKLSDFGLAIPKGSNLHELGLRDYAYVMHRAPELELTDEYSIVTDIYACGVTLYRLVNGDIFLPSNTIEEMRLLAAQGKWPNRDRYRFFVPRTLRAVINRAMNIDPSLRFQSGDSMRHALEQVAIETDWDEKKVSNGIEWTSTSGVARYNVALLSGEKRIWDVHTRRGNSTLGARRITKLCLQGVSKSEAEIHAKRVLQDITAGKLS